MQLNKVKISEESTKKLSRLKGFTGLTPNILCRLGICLSLNDPTLPTFEIPDEDGMEFNRYTLTGEYDAYYIALLKERYNLDDIEISIDITKYFKAHLNRGVNLLYNRVKSISDIPALLPHK